MGKGAGKGGREVHAQSTLGSTAGSVGDRPLNRTRLLQTGASYTLRKGDASDTSASLVVPEWSVPCQGLQWEEPRYALDKTRDRTGKDSTLMDGISREHRNRLKIDEKLPGPGHSELKRSYNKKFADDPDPYDAPVKEVHPVRCTILKEVEMRKSGAFAKEHKETFHPLFAYRVCRPSTFLREDTSTRKGGSIRLNPIEDGTTMANKTWKSLTIAEPAGDQFSSDRMRTRPMGELTSPGKGRVGNRLGETTNSLRAEFTPQQTKKTTQGEAYISRNRFHEPSTTNMPPVFKEQSGLLKTRWPERITQADPAVKQGRASTADAPRLTQRMMRPSNSSILETEPTSTLGGTATFAYKGRESRAVPPPIHAPAFFMNK